MKTRTVYWIMVFSACLPAYCNGQFFDSLRVKAGTQATVASEKYQPLWIVANHFGTIADRQVDLSSFIRTSNKHVLIKHEELNSELLVERYDILTISYGLNVYNNNLTKKTIIEEGYGRVDFKNWSFRAGRFEEISGDIDKDLSSGSLGISGNSLPVPKIGIAVTEYTNVPFTNGWLQFKGTFAHGWFGNNRYMKNAYYHEKTFYMRLNTGRLKLYGGLQHFVEWGGRRGNTQLERSWKGFWDVVFVKEADDGSVGTAVNGRRPSRPGDQRGLIEAGADWENDKIKLHGYAQMPFESGEEIDTRNRSVLVGLSLTAKKENQVVKKLLAEIIYTKQMNDFVKERQRNSYYNNGFYKTGWEYEDNIIGTPLFINRVRAGKYFPEIKPFGWDDTNEKIPGNANILNNRISGLHIGALYKIKNFLSAKTLITYTRNYGKYSKDQFKPVKVQFYTLQEIGYNIFRWNFKLAIACDFGQLSNNTGMMLGASYQLF